MEVTPPYGHQAPVPSVDSQITYVQILESRLRHGEQIQLEQADLPMITGINQSLQALRLLMQVEEMKQTKD